MVWIALIALFILLYPFRPLPRKQRHVLDVYFGVPGSGKTTFAAWLTKQCLRESWVIRLCKRWPENKLCKHILEGKHFRRATAVYSNVPINRAKAEDQVKTPGRD